MIGIQSIIFQRLSCYFLALLLSILLSANINDNPESDVGLTSLITLESSKPFVYRSFIPQSAKFISIFFGGLSPLLVARMIGAACFFLSFITFDRLVHYARL